MKKAISTELTSANIKKVMELLPGAYDREARA
jgi:hypothetical protein